MTRAPRVVSSRLSSSSSRLPPNANNPFPFARSPSLPPRTTLAYGPLRWMSTRAYLPTIPSDASLDWEPVQSPTSPQSSSSNGSGRINAGAFWKTRNSQDQGMDKVSPAELLAWVSEVNGEWAEWVSSREGREGWTRSKRARPSPLRTSYLLDARPRQPLDLAS